MSSTDKQYSDPAATLSDVALSDLQLRQQPFTSDPNSGESGESFIDDIAEAQLDDIKQALISGDDLLLILGPDGSGKSTLLNQLGAKSGQRIQCFSVRGSERFSTANLFAGMLEAFKKQPPEDLKLMLDELIPCLQGMADHNTLGAVVLDDADLIPEAELTKLLSGMLYLNSSDETLIRVTLAAPTEFEERIPELLPEGADLPYSSLAIDAFDKDRSAAYLDYRLQQAGLTGDFPFTEADIASINEQAGGRPGQLHTVAAQHLNSRDENFAGELPPELAEQNKKASGGGWFEKFGGLKLLVGAAAIAMIFAGLFWLKPGGNNVPDDRYKVVESKNIGADDTTKEQRLADERKAAEKLAEENLAKEQMAEQKLADDKLAQEKLAEQNTADQPSTATSNNNNQSNNNEQDNNAQSNTGAQTSSTIDNAATIAAKAEAAKAEAQRQAKLERDAAQKLEQEKLAAEQAKQAEEKQAEQKMVAAAAQAAQEEEAEAEAAADKATSQAESSLNNLESPNWILVQNPDLFTVQMSASKDRKSVETFLARTGLEPPNSIFSFNRNGATWYALVHGLYDNIEQARQDIEKMPEQTRSNQPWIRAVGRIQKAMKEQ